MKLQANTGEMIYDFLVRVIEFAEDNCCEVQATCNCTTIRVFHNSCIDDICDKFDMQRVIDKMKGN